jgi:ATP/maltotriose-dependent transcriptional regulator MalT
MGAGKTSLVADLARGNSAGRPVIWHRLRPGVNDSLAALLFELAEHLRSRGRTAAAESLTQHPLDVTLTGRLVVRDLDGLSLLVVIDDWHAATDGADIAGFLDDAVTRLPDLHVATVSRHSTLPIPTCAAVEVTPMTRLETQQLLEHLDVRASPEMASAIQRWTAGLPQLIRLAASWMRTVGADEVTRELTGFTESDEVQDFLLGSIAELMGAADRSVLDAASVFRQRFDDQALAYVAGLTLGTVRDTSRRLVRTHVGTRSRDGGVAFFHSSVREYFYSRLSDRQRASLHERAAEWCEQKGLAEEAAYHRAAAAAPALAG